MARTYTKKQRRQYRKQKRLAVKQSKKKLMRDYPDEDTYQDQIRWGVSEQTKLEKELEAEDRSKVKLVICEQCLGEIGIRGDYKWSLLYCDFCEEKGFCSVYTESSVFELSDAWNQDDEKIKEKTTSTIKRYCCNICHVTWNDKWNQLGTCEVCKEGNRISTYDIQTPKDVPTRSIKNDDYVVRKYVPNQETGKLDLVYEAPDADKYPSPVLGNPL